MGNWNISIRGVGPHHNSKKHDVEQMAKVFTEALKAAGHSVVAAAVTTGGENDVLTGLGLLKVED